MAKLNIVKLLAIGFVIVVGLLASYFIVGLPLALIFLIVCFDSLVVARIVRMGVETGMELATFATILAAIFYGPWMAFTFGFFIVPLITGVLGLILWGFSPVHDVGWPPLIPSPDSLTFGLAGLVVGFVYSQFNFLILTGLVGVMVRTILQIGKEFLMGGSPRMLAYIINSALTIALLFATEEIILLIK